MVPSDPNMSESSDPKPWTVMLYMAASRDEQTEAAAIRDLKELEKIGTTDQCNVIVQIDRRWPGYSERYCVRKGSSELRGSFPPAGNLRAFLKTGDLAGLGEIYAPENAEGLHKLLGVEGNELERCLRDRDPDALHKAFSTGNPFVLREFVRWARAEFHAKHYLLVMWGHAFGLGFGRDHGDPLAMPELAKALDPTLLSVPSGQKAVDIVGANACAMSYAEAAYELKDVAHFIVAPEIAMPFAGWPYEAILSAIKSDPDISPEGLGKEIIKLFMESYKNAFEPRSVSLTLLNLEHAHELRPLLKDVVDALNAVITTNGVRDQIANAFLDTAYGEVRPLIDLFDLCDRLMEMDSTDALGVATAAKKLRTFLDRKDGLILEPKPEQPAELEGLRGLGIFAPSVTGAAQLTRLELSKQKYKELSLVKEEETGWADLVYDDLNDALEPLNNAVAEFVNGTGAVTREDRTGVAQLLLSVLRSFARLESTVTASQKAVLGVLNGNNGAKPLGGIGTAAERQSHKEPESRSVFGPPYLRLASGFSQQFSSTADTPSATPRGKSRAVKPPNAKLMKAVLPLANIEDAVANFERTAKKVLTHSRLGLGGTKPDMGGTKPDMGATKPDMGGTKPDMGGTKPDMGLSSGLELGEFDNGVTGLFRQVVSSLQRLEEAVRKLERDVQLALISSPTNGVNASELEDFELRLRKQLKGSFRELTDVAVNAKLTLGAALRHPSEGLGPAEGLGADERQQLAIFGGLSSRNLQLL
jgi:hypothetical protein